jgi:hypothetical protein
LGAAPGVARVVIAHSSARPAGCREQQNGEEGGPTASG